MAPCMTIKSMMADSYNTTQCPICLEDLTEELEIALALPCKHIACRPCFNAFRKLNMKPILWVKLNEINSCHIVLQSRISGSILPYLQYRFHFRECMCCRRRVEKLVKKTSSGITEEVLDIRQKPQTKTVAPLVIIEVAFSGAGYVLLFTFLVTTLLLNSLLGYSTWTLRRKWSWFKNIFYSNNTSDSSSDSDSNREYEEIY